ALPGGNKVVAYGYTDENGKFRFEGETTFIPAAYVGVVNNFYKEEVWAEALSCYFSSSWKTRRYRLDIEIDTERYADRRETHLYYYRMRTGQIAWKGLWPRSHTIIGYAVKKDVCPRRRADASEAE
ncbi:MAG: hypothetical protein AAGH45_07910, partial [Pseudomonadota bacterium]